jgi:hypothetical protein
MTYTMVQNDIVLGHNQASEIFKSFLNDFLEYFIK